MQNIEAILTELGIEVPADKKENLTKKVAENYITKAEHEKKLGKVETDRDTWKEKAETAETTLKGFEGVDLDTMQKELSDWKKKAEDAEKDAQAKLYERDFADALKTEFEGIKFSSEAAKRAIMAEVKDAGLKLFQSTLPQGERQQFYTKFHICFISFLPILSPYHISTHSPLPTFNHFLYIFSGANRPGISCLLPFRTKTISGIL